MRKLTAIILSLFLFSSCNFFSEVIFGIKQYKKFDEEKYNSFLSSINKFNFSYESYIADTSNLFAFLKYFNSPNQKKNFYQPTQILYFNAGKLVSFHAGCYAQQGLKINWNLDNRFMQFIPKSAINLDSLNINLNQILASYNIDLLDNRNGNYILIFWSLMTNKMSKNAIKTVVDNINNFEKQNDFKIILINMDKIFISLNK